MGYARKDVEKTKKIAKKFDRYMSLKNNLKPTHFFIWRKLKVFSLNILAFLGYNSQ